jgi:DNA-binding winged helix-turn-helix (wHTH) protein/tetratricopeptide (TPR) repeat protein
MFRNGNQTAAMTPICLGRVEILPTQHCLLVDGKSVHIEPKVMAVLMMLIERSGEVVSRKALLDSVWAGRVVGDEALTRCISELRAALGDRASDPEFIQTVPKQGYRLLQPPRPAAEKAPVVRAARWPLSIAAVVLMAVTATIATYLTDGRVDPESTLLAMQDTIMARVTAAVGIGGDEPLRVARNTTDIDALDLYLLGRHHWHTRTPEGLARAVEYFQQAIAEDPLMSDAYSGLADAYLLQANYDERTTESAITLARPLIDQALALDPESADAYASRGILLQKQRNHAGAEAALARAVALNPNHAMAHMWRGNAVLALGRLTEAYAHYQSAFRLDPQHPAVTHNYLTTTLELGEYAQAEAILNERQSQDSTIRKTSAQLALIRGDWGAVLAAADAMDDDPAGAGLLRWRVQAWRNDLALAELHLAEVVRSDPDDERVYLAALEHQVLAPDSSRFDEFLSRWQSRDDLPVKVDLMARAWQAIAELSLGNLEVASEGLAAVLAEFEESHPPFRMKLLGHLLVALERSGQRDAYELWRSDALAAITEFVDSGWGSFEFQVERGYLLAAAGEILAAADSFRAAARVGDLSALALHTDPRLADSETTELLKDFI